MVDRRSRQRDARKAGLIAAAQRRIEGAGLQNLRARDIAADTGSALGGLYNVFADLDDLILHVNAGTLARLRRLAEEQSAGAGGPRAAMQALAAAYLAFARENFSLWRALFEHRLAAEKPLPDWYETAQAGLIHLIATPLRALDPTLDADALLVRARTVFGAVHGVVAISLENRFVGVPEADLERELATFVDTIVTGAEARRGAGQASASDGS